jgi:four helix bundle protein
VSGNTKENIMAMIQRFEDIQAWQEARKLVKMIYSLTNKELFSKDFGMRDQIRRASVSVMANIAEGFDCESKVEFARFLGIARRSAVEVQSILYAALDAGYISNDEFNQHYEQARIAKALTGGFKRSLTNKSSV